MITKKQKLITAIKTLKESNLIKEYKYAGYGPQKQELFCFNTWMYHKLYPKTKFKTLIDMSEEAIGNAVTEDVLMHANVTHYEYTHKLINFKTAIKLIIEEIKS